MSNKSEKMKDHILSIVEGVERIGNGIDELLVLSRPPSQGAGTEDEPSSDAKDDDKPITVEVKTVKCSGGSDQSDQSDQSEESDSSDSESDLDDSDLAGWGYTDSDSD